MTAALGTVIVVDDDQAVREALGSLLRSSGLAVVLFGSVAEFRAVALPRRPRCLVLDVRLPGRSGLDLQEELWRTGSDLKTIFITGHGDIPMSVRAMKLGAVEFLPKPFRDIDLLDAVNAALERDRAEWQEDSRNAEVQSRYATLTARERQVVDLVAAGQLNKQIAGTLEISEVTVKVHRARAMMKMGATSLAELVRMLERARTQGAVRQE